MCLFTCRSSHYQASRLHCRSSVCSTWPGDYVWFMPLLLPAVNPPGGPFNSAHIMQAPPVGFLSSPSECVSELLPFRIPARLPLVLRDSHSFLFLILSINLSPSLLPVGHFSLRLYYFWTMSFCILCAPETKRCLVMTHLNPCNRFSPTSSCTRPPLRWIAPPLSSLPSLVAPTPTCHLAPLSLSFLFEK